MHICIYIYVCVMYVYRALMSLLYIWVQGANLKAFTHIIAGFILGSSFASGLLELGALGVQVSCVLSFAHASNCHASP